MVVLSKCSDKYILHGFTCYEVGHTWSVSCLQAWKDVGFASYRTAFKIYFPLYLLALFLKKRNQQRKSSISQDLLKMLPELLRSTFFLGTNGLSFIVAFCLWRKCFPFYYLFQVLTCAPPCSALALSVERPDRRALLSVYMANIAVETIYLMLKTRKLVRPLPYGEVLLFSLSTSFFFFMYQSNRIGGSMKSGIRFLLGEADQRKAASQQRLPSTGCLPKWAQAALQALPGGGRPVGAADCCPTGHPDSCLANAICKFGRMFAFGFGLQSLLRLATALAAALQSARRRHPGALRDALLHPDGLRLGAFLGGLSAIYQAVGCLLARCHGNQRRPWHAAVSGLAAGLSMLAYRSSSVAMYCASKAVELACSLAVGAGWLPRVPHMDILLYAVSTGLVFHCAVFEPHSLRPAYWRFLLRMTDGHFDDINRRILDGLNGGHSSLLKPDFWPKYDPTVTSLALGPQEMVRRLMASRDSFNK